MVKLLKIVKIVEKCKKKCQQMSTNVKNCPNCQKIVKNCHGQVMFHHSDQMSQRSQVSRMALWCQKVKVPWLSESVSQWQGHLLSCSGVAKKGILKVPTNSVFKKAAATLSCLLHCPKGVLG